MNMINQVTLLIGFVLLGGVFGEQLQLTLPFQDIIICAPFNVLIRPSTDPNNPYLTTIDAAQQVLDALDLEYVEQLLTISTRASFESSEAVRIILELPFDKLRSVNVELKVDVAILGSFVVPNLLLENIDDGTLFVSDTQVLDMLTITASKNGFVIFDGLVNNADLDLTRNGRVFISSLSGDVQYQGSGRSKVYLNPTREELVIEGNAASLAEVNVAGGSCNQVCTVKGRSRFRSPCKCIAEVRLPEFDPQFTCGLRVSGSSQCTGGVVVARSSVQVEGAFAGGSAGSGSAVSTIVIEITDCVTAQEQLKMIL